MFSSRDVWGPQLNDCEMSDMVWSIKATYNREVGKEFCLLCYAMKVF